MLKHKTYLSKYTKRTTKRKNLDNPLSLRESKIEIDFLIDSGAESTWKEIKTLHPNLSLLKTSSKFATARGSTLVKYGKIQLFLLPTRTMEQNKILNKPFKQIFHITDIKHNLLAYYLYLNIYQQSAS